MKVLIPLAILAAVGVASHSTDSTNGFPQFDGDHTITLRAGQSVILASGQKAKVPYGTAVREPGGGSAVLKGHGNNVNATGGVIVSVPVDAVGPADNIVIAK